MCILDIQQKLLNENFSLLQVYIQSLEYISVYVYQTHIISAILIKIAKIINCQYFRVSIILCLPATN